MTLAGILRVSIIAVLVAALEIACRSGAISSRVLLAPSQMFDALVSLLASGTVNTDLFRTANAVVFAFLGASVSGFALGLSIHSMPRLRRALEPLFATYYSVPFFVFYPILVGIFDLSIVPIIIMGVAFAVVAMIIATLNGLDRLPRVLQKVAKVHHLGAVSSALLLKLPATAPHLLTGVKLSVAYSFIGVIASEFILADSGVGHAIAFAYNSFDNHKMYALVLLVLLVVTTINIALYLWEQSLLRRRDNADRGIMVGRGEGAGSTAITWLDSGLIVAGLLLFWQALYWLVGREALSSPVETLQLIVSLFGTAEFWGHVGETLEAFGKALLISFAAGIAIGIWLGMHRLSGQVGEPMIVALYAVPKITLLPVMLLIFGIGMQSKIAFGVLHGVIPIIIFTLNAIRKIRPIYLKLAKTAHLSRRQTITAVVIPATLPEIISGLRIGFSLTLLGVLVGEMFASKRGLGHMIMSSIGIGDVETTMAVAVFLFLVAGIGNAILLYFDRRLSKQA